MSKHPIQPIDDVKGVKRFRQNKIVRFLLDNGGHDLTRLTSMPFDDGDWEQFVQLLGYSLSGVSELSFVSDDTFDVAERMAESGETEEQARLWLSRQT